MSSGTGSFEGDRDAADEGVVLGPCGCGGCGPVADAADATGGPAGAAALAASPAIVDPAGTASMGLGCGGGEAGGADRDERADPAGALRGGADDPSRLPDHRITPTVP